MSGVQSGSHETAGRRVNAPGPAQEITLMDARKATPGIDVRHRQTCPAPRADGRCCKPAYRAEVYDRRAEKRVRRTFPTLAAAKRWRQDALVDVRNGSLRVQATATVRQVAEQWLADAERGIVTNRSGDRYKPSAIRAYRQSLRLRILDDLGDRPFAEITRGDLQRLSSSRQGSRPRRCSARCCRCARCTSARSRSTNWP